MLRVFACAFAFEDPDWYFAFTVLGDLWIVEALVFG